MILVFPTVFFLLAGLLLLIRLTRRRRRAPSKIIIEQAARQPEQHATAAASNFGGPDSHLEAGAILAATPDHSSWDIIPPVAPSVRSHDEKVLHDQAKTDSH